jgi:hypothetical protein
LRRRSMQRLRCRSSRLRRGGRCSSRARGFCFGGGGGFFGVFGGFGEGEEVLAREFGVLDINGARVGLLLGDADLREILDEDFGLDLEFPGQLVDADLVRF